MALCLIMMAVPSCAQRRQIGDAKTILLRGKDFEKAEKMMTDLLKDTNNLQNKRIYDVWLQAVEKQYGQLNDKMYVKQKVDTAKLFTLTQRIFTVGERLDSLDMLPDKKGKVSPEYRKDNAQRLTSYRPNLFFGGAYYVRKQNFRNAYDFFEMYLDCDNQPLFEGYDFLSDDPRMGEAAYWATYCGYRMDDPMLCLRYADIARRDTSKLEYTLQYICESWRKLGNDSLYFNYGDGARGELITDDLNNVYIGSTTFSSNFPTTPGSCFPLPSFGQNGIVLKIDYNLRHLIWSTYLGGSHDDAV